MTRQRLIAETNIERYIARNRGKCPKGCGVRVFWCTTSKGRRIPIDFPDTALGHTSTHELVPGYREGGDWDGTIEARPTSSGKATHSCHFDNCKGDPKERAAAEESAWQARMAAERAQGEAAWS